MSQRKPKRPRESEDTPDRQDDGVLLPAGPSPQRRHIGRACTTCRKSHNRCDGKRPDCGTCVTNKRQCLWSSASDRRRRPEADTLAKANQVIVTLEGENQQLRDTNQQLREICRRNGIDLSKELEEAPRLTITVAAAEDPFAPGFDGGYGAPPLTPSSDSSWSLRGSLSPLSIASPLPSPLAPNPGQFLDVPIGAHGRSGYSTDDDGGQLPHDAAGHMGTAYGDLYGHALIDRPDGSPASIAVPGPWAGTSVPASPIAVAGLSAGFAAMTFHGTERQGAADRAPAYSNAGPELLAPDLAVQAQGFGFPAAGFDIDASSSMLFAGSSMDVPFERVYRNGD